jgi:hypothetical protein
MQLIEKLMAASTKREKSSPNADTKDNSEWRAVGVMLTAEDVAILQKIAKGRPLDQVMREIMLEKMREILKNE